MIKRQKKKKGKRSKESYWFLNSNRVESIILVRSHSLVTLSHILVISVHARTDVSVQIVNPCVSI